MALPSPLDIRIEQLILDESRWGLSNMVGNPKKKGYYEVRDITYLPYETNEEKLLVHSLCATLLNQAFHEENVLFIPMEDVKNGKQKVCIEVNKTLLKQVREQFRGKER